MTPTPWAQAVEAMRKIPHPSQSPGRCDNGPCDDCLNAYAEACARAAVPHLLRAVTEGMESVAPEAPNEVEIAGRFIPRPALLSALTASAEQLTDAAGRVAIDAVTPDPHIGPHEYHIGRSPQ